MAPPDHPPGARPAVAEARGAPATSLEAPGHEDETQPRSKRLRGSGAERLRTSATGGHPRSAIGRATGGHLVEQTSEVRAPEGRFGLVEPVHAPRVEVV